MANPTPDAPANTNIVEYATGGFRQVKKSSGSLKSGTSAFVQLGNMGVKVIDDNGTRRAMHVNPFQVLHAEAVGPATGQVINQQNLFLPGGAVIAPLPIAINSVLQYNGTQWVPAVVSGSVSSVGLSAPSQFTVTGSPVTTSGTLAFAWANQSANLIFSGPSSGGAAAPTFRALVNADFPSGLSPSITGLTLSGLTLGSVVFAGTAGVLSQDNTNFFWDNTKKVLSTGGQANSRIPSGFSIVASNASDSYFGAACGAQICWIEYLAGTGGFVDVFDYSVSPTPQTLFLGGAASKLVFNPSRNPPAFCDVSGINFGNFKVLGFSNVAGTSYAWQIFCDNASGVYAGTASGLSIYSAALVKSVMSMAILTGNITIPVGVLAVRQGATTVGANTANVGGIIFNHFANAGNTTTVETDLYSDTIPASTLGTNGDKLEAVYGLALVNSTSTKEVRVYFAGTVIFDSGALSVSASSDMIVYVTIIRDSSTSIRFAVSANTTGAATGAFANVGTLGGLTLTSTNILKITGQAAGVGAATNDIIAQLSNTEWLPAA